MPPRIVNAHAQFPEGPAWVGTKLYYAEYGRHSITVWDGRRNDVLWTEAGAGPAAAVPFAGGLAVTAYDAGALIEISMTGQTLRRYDRDAGGRRLVGPNDAVSDRHGGLYLTASGPWEKWPIVGAVYYLRHGGILQCVAEHLHFANGIALSADGRLLYVSESEAGRVIAFSVGADGTLSDRRLFVRMFELGEPPDAFPDGIKLGPDGNFYIGLLSAGRIVVVTPGGRLVRKIEVPSAGAPNLAFSPDGKTAYITGIDDKQTPPYPGKVYAVDL